MGFDNVNVNVSGPVQPTSTYKTKVLKGNHSFVSQVTEPNMKYVIKHNFDLGSSEVTIPENCILEFDGGSIGGAYTLTGNNTGIKAGKVKIFDDDVTISGSWSVIDVYPEWFGIFPNNSSLDATPAINKLRGFAGANIVFGSGEWYLSECLINGSNFNVLGNSSGHNTETIFKPFGQGQRFILKLGGRSDFENPTSHGQTYNDVKCEHFKLEGVMFNTEGYTLTSAGTSSDGGKKCGALCLDCAVNGIIAASGFGISTTLYVVDTWEVDFKYFAVGIMGTLQEADSLYDVPAIYYDPDKHFGGTTDCVYHYLYAEGLAGLIMKGDTGTLIIDNLDIEVYDFGGTVYKSGLDASDYIYNNIRNREALLIRYLFDINAMMKIGNVLYSERNVVYSHQDTPYAVGLFKLYSGELTVDSITRTEESPLILEASHNLNQPFMYIGNITSGKWVRSSAIHIYTFNVSQTIRDTGEDRSEDLSIYIGGVYIEKAESLIDPDLVKLYCDNTIITPDNLSELVPQVSGRTVSNVVFTRGYAAKCIVSMSDTFGRKIKFDNLTHILFTVAVANRWAAEYEVQYYKDGDVVHTDSIKFLFTEVYTHSQAIWDGDYDYCQIASKQPSAVSRIEFVKISAS